ncbi:MAG: hypothetical protein HOF35_10535 [Bacteroidetes bacterium]|jgi:hypothetical protein|nr:hypothetical protein [Bacteroidota bacterium]MBT5530601.1 hypothetical protein [Cytophagia bacterium]
MKTNKSIFFLLALCIAILLSFKADAQSYENAVAFSFGLSLIDNPIDIENQCRFNPTSGFNTGISFYQLLTRRIGINIELKNYQLNFDPNLIHLDFPVPYKERVIYGILEMPIAMMINLNYYADAKCKLYFRGGYSFGVMHSWRFVEYFEDEKIVSSIPPYSTPIGFTELGLEVHQALKHDYIIIFGCKAKITNDIKYYDYTTCWTFDIKFGKLF